MVAADYLLGHLDADLAWMRTTLSRLAHLRAELHPRPAPDDGGRR